MIATIGSIVGDHVCLDGITSRNMKMDLAFARLLVEVSVEEISRKVVIMAHSSGEEFEIPIEFEWVPWSCSHCSCFGHSAEFCPHRPKKELLAAWAKKREMAKAEKAQMVKISQTMEKMASDNGPSSAVAEEEVPGKEASAMAPLTAVAEVEISEKVLTAEVEILGVLIGPVEEERTEERQNGPIDVDQSKPGEGIEEGEWLVPPPRKTTKASSACTGSELVLQNIHESPIDPE